jgi:hypothetical protein
MFDKNNVRDQLLPEKRKELLDAISKDLTADSKILAIFLGGSLGSEMTDCYSDIDLRVVVDEKHLQTYLGNKKERPKRWGNVLYFEDLGEQVPYTIAHFDTFIKVDIFYYSQTQISPSVWYKDIKILYDQTEIISEIKTKSQLLTYKPSVSEVEKWRNKIFAYAHEIYRRTKRGELYYALHCLDMIRWSVAAGWLMDKGIVPNSPGDWAKIEGSRSKLAEWQLSLLAGWYANREADDILCKVSDILPEFLKVNKNLSRIVGIPEENELCKQVFNKIL